MNHQGHEEHQGCVLVGQVIDLPSAISSGQESAGLKTALPCRSILLIARMRSVAYPLRMRFLAIDIGGRRSGLAVGSDVTGMVSPAGQITATTAAQRIDGIARAVDEHGPDALVLGLPLNMDGSEGPPAKAIRELAAELEQRFNLPVHLVDERLTSFAADQQMAQSGMTHRQKKGARDALAAATILRDFLDQQRE